MPNGPTPERSALDRMIGAFRRLQEQRAGAPPAEAAAAPPPTAPASPRTGAQPPPRR